MTLAQSPVVIGVFITHDQAQLAVDHLQRAGFSEQEIGFLTRARVAEPSGTEVEANAASGAVRGGVVGGIFGAAAALLIPGFGPALAGGIIAATLGGLALGATAGGLLGAFSSLGVSDADARIYQDELTRGHTIVTVKVSMGLEAAAKVLQQSGATMVKTHLGIINEVHPVQTSDPTDNLNNGGLR